MINRVVLTGRLTRDPELKYTTNSVANVRFSLAVNRAFKTENGPEADFLNCVAWRKTAELVANYLKKGSLIGVEGRIETGSYEKDGQRIYTTDIVVDNVQFLESRSAITETADSIASGYQPQQPSLSTPSGQPFQQAYQQTHSQPNQFSTQQQATAFATHPHLHQRPVEQPQPQFSTSINITDEDLPF